MTPRVQEAVRFGPAVQAIRSVVFPDRPGCFDIALEGGNVRAIQPAASGEARWLLLPPLANMHAHASRAFSAAGARPASLEDAITKAGEDGRKSTVDDFRRRALRLFHRSLVHGVQRLRTHTEIGGQVGLRAVEGVLAAREEVQGALDVEVVAFATAHADPVRRATSELLHESVRMGASLLGAVPAKYDEPHRSLGALFATAERLGVGVDLHLDEHLDARVSLIAEVVDATVAHGLQGRVAVSHVCSLSCEDESTARHLLGRMAAAQVTLIALPELNLFLQDRRRAWPRERGVAPIRAALAEGVDVRIGSDNVRDWFFPWGDGDMLDAAYVVALAGQVDDARDLVCCMCDGAPMPELGAPASCLLVPAASLDDALARRPAGRVTLRRGRHLLVDEAAAS